MAKLDQLPEKQIIDGFKGVIDFYYWLGIAVARKWPRYKERKPSDAQLAAREAFAYINALYSELHIHTRIQLDYAAHETSLTGKDLAVRAYMKGVVQFMPPEYFASQATLLEVRDALNMLLLNLRAENRTWGYMDTYSEPISDTTLPAGNVNLFGSVVPPDEIWNITGMNLEYLGTPPTWIEATAIIGGITTLIWRLKTPISGQVYTIAPIFTLQEADRVYFSVVGATLNDDFNCNVWGTKMKTWI